MISAILGLFGLGGSELILVLIMFAALIFVILRAARRAGSTPQTPPRASPNNRP